ncbi:glycosyltransferase family 4 protein [Bosea sp. RCC_152_1]|uniref:glycosyltransferase family 4 protein n=1 Tax=Bosea sp. RCC_152_1 TaxID=3239228 RepID=UPI00352660AF
MLRSPLMAPPRRVLITLDAVGGVWRYAIDLARGLGQHGVECLLVGFGPAPGPDGIEEAEALANASLIWPGGSLDWLVETEGELEGAARALTELARDWRPDLLHLNLPSQAVGLPDDLPPVLVASHSCLATWWAAVRGGTPPAAWHWQRRRTQEGLQRAACVVLPSMSHAAATQDAYGAIAEHEIVYNASPVAHGSAERQEIALAAGRWWDEGKNGATLDAAALLTSWRVLMAGPQTGPNGQSCELRHASPLGQLPAPSICALMEHAAVFVAPSLYEPFGLAVLEAAHRGAALVLADIPTFRELWQDAALFVPPREAPAYAQAIDKLMTDRELRSRLARRARLRALDFRSERQVAGMLAAYARACSGSSGHARAQSALRASSAAAEPTPDMAV